MTVSDIAKQSIEDIEMLLALACVLDTPEEAAYYRGLYQHNLENLKAIAAGVYKIVLDN